MENGHDKNQVNGGLLRWSWCVLKVETTHWCESCKRRPKGDQNQRRHIEGVDKSFMDQVDNAFDHE
jgi:hypothetical protein